MKGIICFLLLLSTGVMAEREGGGGDPSEARVNQIRVDLLSWINRGGAKKLKLFDDISLEQYESEMLNVLSDNVVSIIFVEKDHVTNRELQVIVEGAPKTCRGFISDYSKQYVILCNINRFNNMTEAEQYRLIHHEFAGLVRIEKNEGSFSDYSVSDQITTFLEPQKVLKLVVNRKVTLNVSNDDIVEGIRVSLIENPLKCNKKVYSTHDNAYFDNLQNVLAAYLARMWGARTEMSIRLLDNEYLITFEQKYQSDNIQNIVRFKALVGADLKIVKNVEIENLKGSNIRFNSGTILNPVFTEETRFSQSDYYKCEL